MTSVTLPRVVWGQTTASQHVLLVHGLGSNAHTMWRLGEAFAEAGWAATGIDLRGHGVAPRTSRYRIDDFAADLADTRPVKGGSWDLVIGHSIGAASAVVACTTMAEWTQRLCLIDPAITVAPDRQQMVLQRQRHAHDHLTEDDVRSDFPHWHPLDIEHRVRANREASRYALEQAVYDNGAWDRESEALTLHVPTLIVGGDPAVDSMFTGDHANRVTSGNTNVQHVVIPGAGHNVHRDKPAETLATIFAWLP